MKVTTLPADHVDSEFWFPGRWVGGIALIIAPLLFLSGMLLRARFHFFFPQQLEAFNKFPGLIITSYNLFVIGNIFLWPAILTLARLIGKRKNQLAIWGGVFVMFGLFARTFQAGINHLAFQLVRIEGLDGATRIIADSYGAFNIIATLNGTIMFGWILLAAGAFRSQVMGLFRAVALALMAGLMSGVLKGSSLYSIIAATGLCIALIPLGIQVLQNGARPQTKTLWGWSLVTLSVVTALYFLGQAG